MIAHSIATGCLLLVTAAALAAAPGDAPYKVDGNKVDEATLKGWKAWRALACARCHGSEQQGEGTAGPALTDKLKSLTRDEFKVVVLKGRVPQGMPNYDESKTATDNIEGLYAYLKGRSDGAIPPGRLEALP